MISIRSSKRSSSIAGGRVCRSTAITTAALVAGLFLWAAGPASAEDAAAGGVDVAKVWAKNCKSCHGEDGKGQTKAGEKAGVKDLSAPDVKGKLERAKVVDAIKNGVKKEGSEKFVMKAYSEKLSEAEIEALADHSMSFQ